MKLLLALTPWAGAALFWIGWWLGRATGRLQGRAQGGRLVLDMLDRIAAEDEAREQEPLQ